MHLKGALHVHTTCSDGTLTVPEAVRVYEDLGFDFIALTDHDHLLRQDCYEGVELIDTELIVFLGVELTVFEAGYVHVNKIRAKLGAHQSVLENVKRLGYRMVPPADSAAPQAEAKS